ncbi:hypothetical protein [Paraburkholderia sp. J12]|uniref:hypothetical protein n=1 Tax=Paraburkholderia sp. J12 TaxID=2805432 RepID=UPI002ABE6FCD|nr:hypothetical protein [Paraburkholderia sp. J12]
MATVSNPSFDAYRFNASAAIKLFAQGEQWREQVLELQQRRLARDRAALEGTLETLRDARDWSDFSTASQSVLRDYVNASAAIWQEGVAAAMHGAGALADTARDLTQEWHDSLSGLQPGTNTPSALPMREWMAAFERAVGRAYGVSGEVFSGAPGGERGKPGATNEAVGQAHGEQHGR